MKPTHDILLDRWAHATLIRDSKDLKTWRGVLSAWARWLQALLDSTQPRRHLTPELRLQVEAELKYCLADLEYLTTLTYRAPRTKVPPPSLTQQTATGTPHPFIHLLLEAKHKKDPNDFSGTSAVANASKRQSSRVPLSTAARARELELSRVHGTANESITSTAARADLPSAAHV